MSVPNPRVVVCRVAWMDYYRGVTAVDVPRGGGSFVKERGFGHEAFNFQPHQGAYLGYVQSTGRGINLTRLGAQGANSLADVTVIWVAKAPNARGTRVVGWNRKATVYAEYQRVKPTSTRRLPDGNTPSYLVSADNGTLLTRDERSREVPRGTRTQTGMGQSNIWYPDADDANALLAYVNGGEPGRRAKSGNAGARLNDVLRRQAIEKVAMTTVAQWFTERGYNVIDVALQNLGWDLEARLGELCLRLEVKGTSASPETFSVELTPNEFRNMCEPAARGTYRLCVVTDAESKPRLQTYAWSPERNAWCGSDEGHMLDIRELVGARVCGRSERPR